MADEHSPEMRSFVIANIRKTRLRDRTPDQQLAVEFADARDRDVAELVTALGRVMIGGNHIANQLVARVGANFSERFPSSAAPEDREHVLRVLGNTVEYDLWVCWNEIILASNVHYKHKGGA